MPTRTRKIILLDGDEPLMRQVSRVFGGGFIVLHVRNARRAIGLIESDPQIEVLITEQVMRSGDGVELLETVRTLRPHVRRVMVTSYSDLSSIVAGLHSGAIQSLVQKPANDAELLIAVYPEVAERAAQLRKASA
jgi:two-component system response regulator RegA